MFRGFVVGLGRCTVLLRVVMFTGTVCVLRRLPMSLRRALMCGGGPVMSIRAAAQGRGGRLLGPLRVHDRGRVAATQPRRPSTELDMALLQRASALFELLMAVSGHDLRLGDGCAQCRGAKGLCQPGPRMHAMAGGDAHVVGIGSVTTPVSTRDPAYMGNPEQSNGRHGDRVTESAALRAREEAVTDRERVTDEREALADERERVADQRERIANEREAVANRREEAADHREQVADERARSLDERETRLDVRESRLDEYARVARFETETRAERALEAIERARARIRDSSAKIDRNEAAIHRGLSREEREQAEVERETGATKREEGRVERETSAPGRVRSEEADQSGPTGE